MSIRCQSRIPALTTIIQVYFVTKEIKCVQIMHLNALYALDKMQNVFLDLLAA